MQKRSNNDSNLTGQYMEFLSKNKWVWEIEDKSSPARPPIFMDTFKYTYTLKLWIYGLVVLHTRLYCICHLYLSLSRVYLYMNKYELS